MIRTRPEARFFSEISHKTTFCVMDFSKNLPKFSRTVLSALNFGRFAPKFLPPTAKILRGRFTSVRPILGAALSMPLLNSLLPPISLIEIHLTPNTNLGLHRTIFENCSKRVENRQNRSKTSF